jgi:hypothetical protein
MPYAPVQIKNQEKKHINQERNKGALCPNRISYEPRKLVFYYQGVANPKKYTTSYDSTFK